MTHAGHLYCVAMPTHLFVAPEQAIEIEVHDPDGGAAALVVGTIRSIPKMAGRQAYRLVVVGRARPLTDEDEET